MRSVELFAGAGGLGMGLSRAGFHPDVVIEWNRDACQTIRANAARLVDPVSHWTVVQSDVRQFDFQSIKENVDLVSGGPPCQPFSIGGKARGHQDDRDMFPQAIRAVRELRPRAFVFENVKGLTRQAFSTYLNYILLQMRYPELVRRTDEKWGEHLGRLEQHHTKGRPDGLIYNVVHQVLNAADYGVPQKRERVIFVGFRDDDGVAWNFPAPTHTKDVLLWDQWVTGEYWERHEIASKHRPDLPTRTASRIARLRSSGNKPIGEPWLTVRDALFDLPDPEDETGTSNNFHNHIFVPGARAYPGHTGSPVDEPAKTLKAGDHGVPGGENMLAHTNGRVRYFTVRESARLQTFPDNYVFQGAWSEAMRQLGNAVPVRLAEAVAKSVYRKLSDPDANPKNN